MDTFMPHGYCLSWNLPLLCLFVVGNVLVTLSYYSIPASLAVLVSKRRELVFHWMFILFGAFIFACGTTHLIKIWTIWHPDYWLEAGFDAVTGVLSAVTALLLWPLVPKALALPSPAQLEREIEQRKKAEQKFRHLLESAPDAMIFFNQLGEIVLVNERTESLFAYSRDELIGRKVETIIPQTAMDGFAKHSNELGFSRIIRAIGSDDDLYALQKNGNQIPIEMTLSSIDTEDGVLISSAIRDISERKHAEELKRQYERKEANEHFIALLAHELKAPIIGANQVLKVLGDEQLGNLNTKQKEVLNQVIDGNKNTLAMIGDIVEVYQFEKDIENMVLTTLNMADLVNQCVKEADGGAQKKGIKIEVSVPSTIPKLIGNKQSLRRVLQNLLDNAIKVSASESHVNVRLDCTDDSRIELSVKDAGPGIGAIERERIFHRFWQGSLQNHYSPGTGQGLYYCKQIVDAHKGTISYDTELGHGTTFKVILPVQPRAVA